MSRALAAGLRVGAALILLTGCAAIEGEAPGGSNEVTKGVAVPDQEVIAEAERAELMVRRLRFCGGPGGRLNA